MSSELVDSNLVQALCAFDCRVFVNAELQLVIYNSLSGSSGGH